ncbi:sulfurtransferase TusA family protein [Bacteroides sp. 519]|uniref:sulfurtransferase TusA family protein n=1 Tax=Bacteroides sp. 519 TaxID=2302937 RepID=UPI0013D24439|nr:sulfurtransferase TusA family protein [Bacteroides sp. 519]NDV58378.1 sulfurtransferase TusA family protein [Bacteroides sp. 519]
MDTIIDTTIVTKYSPLIPALKAIYEGKKGDKVQIVMDNEQAFQDLKEFLSERGTGFREIYDINQLILQFTL